jgi:hypothetical protein
MFRIKRSCNWQEYQCVQCSVRVDVPHKFRIVKSLGVDLSVDCGVRCSALSNLMSDDLPGRVTEMPARENRNYLALFCSALRVASRVLLSDSFGSS